MIRLSLAILLIIATVGSIAPIVVSGTGRPPIERRLELDLINLQSAMHQYEAQYGEAFSLQKDRTLFEHLQLRFPTLEITPDLLEASSISEDRVDDTERLVLFLSGRLEHVLNVPSYPEMEFAERQLVDRDNDGWFEYVSIEKNPYRLRRGQPVVYCNKLNVWLTSPLGRTGGWSITTRSSPGPGQDSNWRWAFWWHRSSFRGIIDSANRP